MILINDAREYVIIQIQTHKCCTGTRENVHLQNDVLKKLRAGHYSHAGFSDHDYSRARIHWLENDVPQIHTCHTWSPDV